MQAHAQLDVVVEYVKNIEAAKKFYVDVLGMKVERENPGFIQFGNFAIAGDAPMSPDATEELYWLVDDAQASYERLSALAPVCMPLRELPFGKLFGIHNPDGRPRYVLQLAAQRPSTAV